MRRLDKVYNLLYELCMDQYKEDGKIIGASTSMIAQRLKLHRSNVSGDLNELVKIQKIKKSDGRPVLYKIISAEFENHEVLGNDEKDIFNSIIGSKLSLKNAVQQAKAAIIYPPNGLHTLLYGETGTGKSLFAEIMHKYAIDTSRIEINAPFVSFNCADYANNPQLLMSQLFGVKKGAYTGASRDSTGIVEKANGGILFLDEVHRLPPEGQEMLFYLIDKGLYRKLGDMEVQYKAELMIICATTEDIQSALLKTFLRRIPIIISLPSLKDRSLEERYDIIKNFFNVEAVGLQNNVMVTSNVLKAFLLYNCSNNIGQLRSDIKLCCARAFLRYMMKKDNELCVHSKDLPEYIRRGLFKYREEKEKIDRFVDKDYFTFSTEKCVEGVYEDRDLFNFYESLEDRRRILESNGLDEDDVKLIMGLDIEKYIKKYMNHFATDDLDNEDKLYKVVDKKIVEIVNEFLRYASVELDKTFDSKILYGLSMHVSSSVERLVSGKKIINHQLEDVKKYNRKEFLVSKILKDKIQDCYEIEVPDDEVGFVAMFLCVDSGSENRSSRVGIIIAMHGETSATSMADVVNKLLNEDYAIGYNMPLSQRPEMALSNITEIIKQSDNENGILLLVDMGSLVLFGDMIYERTGIEVKTVEMVSTPIVLEATRKALLGASLEEVYDATVNLSPYVGRVYKENFNFDNGLKKYVIVTACITGEGAAIKLKSILEKKLNLKQQSIDIIPMDILSKETFNKKLMQLKGERNILAVVSAIKPDDDTLLFISASEIFNEQKVSILNDKINTIDKIEMINNMEDVISENIKIDGHRFIGVFMKFFIELFNKGIMLDEENLIGLMLHIACALEFILNGDKPQYRTRGITISKDNFNNFDLIKNIVNVFEREYNIIISDEECVNIIRIIYSR